MIEGHINENGDGDEELEISIKMYEEELLKQELELS